jgi:hypothetical protein
VTTRADVVDAIPSWPRWLQRELRAAPAYLATVRADGSPRVHPVTPIVTEGLYVFMESTPPKGADLPVRSQCARHNGVLTTQAPDQALPAPARQPRLLAVLPEREHPLERGRGVWRP